MCGFRPTALPLLIAFFPFPTLFFFLFLLLSICFVSVPRLFYQFNGTKLTSSQFMTGRQNSLIADKEVVSPVHSVQQILRAPTSVTCGKHPVRRRDEQRHVW